MLQRATKPVKELIALNPPQNDLQNPSDLGPGVRKASSSSKCSRRRQQVAASRQQEQGCRAPDTTQCVTRCKNGEKCEVDVFRCHGTQSRAARNRRNVNSKSSLPQLALLLSARSPVNPAAVLIHQKWRGVRNAPFAWPAARGRVLWHSATRGRQQEKYSLVSWGCQS